MFSVYLLRVVYGNVKCFVCYLLKTFNVETLLKLLIVYVFVVCILLSRFKTVLLSKVSARFILKLAFDFILQKLLTNYISVIDKSRDRGCRKESPNFFWNNLRNRLISRLPANITAGFHQNKFLSLC